MKVGLDISQIAHNGGVSTYTKNIAEQLQKIKDLEMVYFYSSLRKSYHGQLKNVKSFKLPPSLFELFFNQLRIIPIEKFIGKIDIFHSSDWAQPPSYAKKITTYHDVIPIKYPKWSHKKIVEVHIRRLKLVEKEVDKVIAVSQSTKKDLLEVSSIPEDKILVINEGVSDIFKPQSESKIKEFRIKYQLPESFVLAIGGIGERRNLSRIKEAVGNYPLIVIGETMPWVTEIELPLLYSSAKVLLYPSLYEGFGLPILEAMSCGTPVVTSNVSSMPEVAGNAALYVNPVKVDDISKNLKIIMSDEKIRESLIIKGFNQARKFSWEQCAQKTANIYYKMMDT